METEQIELVQFRKATLLDLPTLVEMLADDEFGKDWEKVSDPIDPRYVEAFHEINTDPKQEILIFEDNKRVALGTLHIIHLRFLNHIGQRAVMFESVRIRSQFRGLGLGSRMIQMAIQHVQKQNVDIIQLTSNKMRKGAIRFYQTQGFVNSHEGLKYDLSKTSNQ